MRSIYVPSMSGTPGANTNTYPLLDTTAPAYAVTDAGVVMPSAGASDARYHGFRRYVAALKTSHLGTLKGYASADGGSNWHQFYQRIIPPTEIVRMREVSVRIGQHRDVRFDWVNGGSAQTTWYVGQELTDSDELVGHGYDDAAYIVGGDMAAGFNGPAIQVGPEGKLVAQMQWTNAGARTGTITLQGLIDGTNYKPVPNAADAIGTANQPNNNNGDIVAYWRELRPFKRVRLVYASTGGSGANTSFAAQITTW
jgi:hypothetical protein